MVTSSLPVDPHKSLSGPDLLPESSTPGGAGVYAIPLGCRLTGDLLSLEHLCHQGDILWATGCLRLGLRGLEGGQKSSDVRSSVEKNKEL